MRQTRRTSSRGGFRTMGCSDGRRTKRSGGRRTGGRRTSGRRTKRSVGGQNGNNSTGNNSTGVTCYGPNNTECFA